MKTASQILVGRQDRALEWVEQGAIVVSASLFVTLCARITLPLPFTPVPLSMQNFGVLVVGLMLGWRRGFAALVLYLAEGASGLPVFSPVGPGGLAQLFGPTGGFLLAYPFVAALAGWIFQSGKIQSGKIQSGMKSFVRAVFASLLADVVLFAGGVSWLAIITHSFAQAARFGLYWFMFAEAIKIIFAAAIASGRQSIYKPQIYKTKVY